MDYYHLVHRSKCKCIVITEMVLAGVRLVLFFLVLTGYIYYSNSKDSKLLEAELHLHLDIFHWIILFEVLIIDLTLLRVGQKVLHGCREGADLRKAGLACKIWCYLEIFRMLEFVVLFLIDVYQLSFNVGQYALQIPQTVVVIFGWFFVNEYKKELRFQAGSQLPMFSILNGFQQPSEVIYCPPSIPNINYRY